jgi:xylitol oxidase
MRTLEPCRCQRAWSLITGTGDQVRIDHSSPEFAGAVVHLGALGVVTEVTLAIEPSFEVRQVVYEYLPWDQLTGSFEEVMAAGYSVSAITNFAGADLDMLWVNSRVDDDPSAAIPAELFGAPAATEKLHVTRGNDPLTARHNLASPVPGTSGYPTFCSSSLPAAARRSRASIYWIGGMPVRSSTHCGGLGTRLRRS